MAVTLLPPPISRSGVSPALRIIAVGNDLEPPSRDLPVLVLHVEVNVSVRIDPVDLARSCRSMSRACFVLSNSPATEWCAAPTRSSPRTACRSSASPRPPIAGFTIVIPPTSHSTLRSPRPAILAQTGEGHIPSSDFAMIPRYHEHEHAAVPAVGPARATEPGSARRRILARSLRPVLSARHPRGRHRRDHRAFRRRPHDALSAFHLAKSSSCSSISIAGALLDGGWLQAEVRSARATPGTGRLLAIFDVFDEWFRVEGFEGCTFINVMLESAVPQRRCGAASIAHLERIRDFLAELAAEAGIRERDGFARKWHILMKGCIVAGCRRGPRRGRARSRDRRAAARRRGRARPGSYPNANRGRTVAHRRRHARVRL